MNKNPQENGFSLEDWVDDQCQYTKLIRTSLPNNSLPLTDLNGKGKRSHKLHSTLIHTQRTHSQSTVVLYLKKPYFEIQANSATQVYA